ncbi:LysE family translocator [Providencia alcalifaciens]|uniref:LysE family translocator n=1 Tax=Providencia alcalifaciens TaxID=126385 RepID=UPI000445377D|nr:LysE family translocator [Providencia alcalifaciens]ETT05431.1 translocator protein, LysE family [Providencia alcalifaciens F90-2004]EUC94489.1 translocator protein, LysE family [Providencia alcalifaciens PAL-2]MTB33767.1 LysE family translocator [Providencia alcalifaciens]MTD00084.1 LysE family translocator [Providencia alcalifaciens]CAG9415023.1 Leucine efflux protein [Providencia alcalifaciens]
MELQTLLLFSATVIPLVCTPGPDILFISSQGLSGGISAAWKANLGIILGYVAHAILAALGLAAIVAASPFIFHTIKWVGVAYVAYLAVRMLLSALKSKALQLNTVSTKAVIGKAFLTSFLNPKGLLVYFAILPNFIHDSESVAIQSLILSATFITSCIIIYGTIGMVFASMHSKHQYNDKKRRITEGVSGGMLTFAAIGLANS